MKRSLLGAVALGAVIALGSIASAEAKTLVYCSEASPEGFNPQLFTSGTTLDATKPLYNDLVEFIVGTTTLRPALAESWTVSDDGLTYTFMLRKGVKFHGKNFTPTRDFNADDVMFSFERQLDPNNPYSKVSGGDLRVLQRHGHAGHPQERRKGGRLHGQDHPQPSGSAVPGRSGDGFCLDRVEGIRRCDADGQDAGAGRSEPVGTGPFTLESYEKDAVIRYAADRDYWGSKPKLDKLVFAITPDAAVRWAKLKANECQVMPYPNPADVAAMRRIRTSRFCTRKA